MALMLGKLYGALKLAGVGEQEAQAAAEEVAAYERDIAGLRTEIRVVQGLMGVVVVVLFAALWQLFGLRGEVSAGFAKLDTRMTGMEQRIGDLTGRLPERASP